ncbi:hypothetical protein [Natrialbaceae archaeon AArc-T1-2]|uniref:hypothetical protein n=1 Tax=Natrialbaceae archaeon AArc-T1-2 TaxID=3053904 RepID=UPI00255ADDDF|nr:hypothetical protein [Natrialbaceae archaeon AArc-T1-2]WIV67094.1 hypothetical protein QQ977_15630 [Natrialbaceae archaeon AArc-T1-2]
MSVRTDDSPDRKLRRVTTDLEDGRSVDVEITGDPDNHARVDVRIEGGRRWVFGVNEDVAVPMFDLDADGYENRDGELPAWIEPLLRRLGLEGVDA